MAGAEPTGETQSSTDYPPLQDVPPRPHLSYTVQQQRQIVEALIADRENARYTDQVVRYRSGLSSLPPPPGPPQVPAGNLEPAIDPREPGAGPEPPLTEQETLVDFLAALRRQIQSDEPAAAAPAPEARDLQESDPTAPQALLDPSDDASEPAPDPGTGEAPVPAGQGALAARQAASPGALGPTPVPPVRSAVAARLSESPDVVGELLDATVVQTPLPPGKSAVAARLAAPGQVATDTSPAPLPAPRPATVLAPPPIKPVSVPTDPRPTEDRSAGIPGRSMAANAAL